MKTFNTLATDYTTLSRDSSTENLALGKTLINTFVNRILMMRDWTFNRGSLTIQSIAGEWSYPKAYNAERISGIKVRVGDTVYWPKEVLNRDDWEQLTRTRTAVSSDAILRYFIDGDKIEVYPTFSSDGQDITQYYQKFHYDLAETDYATGTVSRSASSRTVIGTGTTFDEYMVGRYIQFEDEPYWDRIESVITTTKLVTARASRTAQDDDTYVISELIPLSPGTEDVPLWGALMVYFQSKENPTQATYYKQLYDEGLLNLIRRDAKSTGNVLESDDLDYITRLDINDYPDTIS